ncbi:MAG: hypothetical protein ACYTAS_21980, partial [Planctomycetota bacterium]
DIRQIKGTACNLISQPRYLQPRKKRAYVLVMERFGYGLLRAPVKSINWDAKVKVPMNEINAAERMRVAAFERSDGDRILKIMYALQRRPRSLGACDRVEHGDVLRLSAVRGQIVQDGLISVDTVARQCACAARHLLSARQVEVALGAASSINSIRNSPRRDRGDRHAHACCHSRRRFCRGVLRTGFGT